MVSKVTDHSILSILVVVVTPIARKSLAILAFHWCLKQPGPDSSRNFLTSFGCRVVGFNTIIFIFIFDGFVG